jgi:hypothetical protein
LPKRSDKLGALIASLPLDTVLALIWLHLERQPEQKLGNHACVVHLLVRDSYAAYVRRLSLLASTPGGGALAASILITVACFAAFAVGARAFGVELL